MSSTPSFRHHRSGDKANRLARWVGCDPGAVMVLRDPVSTTRGLYPLLLLTQLAGGSCNPLPALQAPGSFKGPSCVGILAEGARRMSMPMAVATAKFMVMGVAVAPMASLVVFSVPDGNGHGYSYNVSPMAWPDPQLRPSRKGMIIWAKLFCTPQ